MKNRRKKDPVIESTRIGMKNQQQVAVQSFEDEFAAEIARGHLESEGIEAKVIKDDAGGMFPSLQQTGGVQVLVAEARLDEAKKILLQKLK
jgi:hypothetical protein